MSAYYQYNMSRSTNSRTIDSYIEEHYLCHEIAQEARTYWRMLRTFARR